MTKTSSSIAEGRNGRSSQPPVADENSPETSIPSDWVRFPKPGQRLGGLTRSTWYELIESGRVKGACLKKKHAQKGIRLIFWPSADAYLKGQMVGGA